MKRYEVEKINNKSYRNYVENYGHGGYEYLVLTVFAESKEEAEELCKEEGYTVYVKSYEEVKKNEEYELYKKINYMEKELANLKAELAEIRRKNKRRG